MGISDDKFHQSPNALIETAKLLKSRTAEVDLDVPLNRRIGARSC